MANLQKDLAIINKYPVKPRALSARGGSAMKSGLGIRTNLKTAILSRLRQEFPPQNAIKHFLIWKPSNSPRSCSSAVLLAFKSLLFVCLDRGAERSGCLNFKGRLTTKVFKSDVKLQVKTDAQKVNFGQ